MFQIPCSRNFAAVVFARLAQALDVRLIRLVSHAAQINEGHMLRLLSSRGFKCYCHNGGPGLSTWGWNFSWRWEATRRPRTVNHLCVGTRDFKTWIGYYTTIKDQQVNKFIKQKRTISSMVKSGSNYYDYYFQLQWTQLPIRSLPKKGRPDTSAFDKRIAVGIYLWITGTNSAVWCSEWIVFHVLIVEDVLSSSIIMLSSTIAPRQGGKQKIQPQNPGDWLNNISLNQRNAGMDFNLLLQCHRKKIRSILVSYDSEKLRLWLMNLAHITVWTKCMDSMIFEGALSFWTNLWKKYLQSFWVAFKKICFH